VHSKGPSLSLTFSPVCFNFIHLFASSIPRNTTQRIYLIEFPLNLSDNFLNFFNKDLCSLGIRLLLLSNFNAVTLPIPLKDSEPASISSCGKTEIRSDGFNPSSIMSWAILASLFFDLYIISEIVFRWLPDISNLGFSIESYRPTIIRV